MLKVKTVTKDFGGIRALNKIDLEIKEGEIVGLIGPNGSGKTTMFNVISGFHKPNEGKVFFGNREINKKAPCDIARMGIGRTFQIVRPFEGLTGLENVLVGAYYGTGKSSTLGAMKKAQECLEFVRLKEKQHIQASQLTLAERKRLEIARALSISPSLLLLDEVFAGLNKTEAKEASDLVLRIHNELGITILLIEHVLATVMATCERLIVFDFGVKLADGKPKEVMAIPEVITAYLGTSNV